MQFQGLLTHKLLGPSTNATPKLLPKLQRYTFMTLSDTGLNDRGAPLWTAWKLVCSAILVSKSSVIKSLNNSTGGGECSRLVFSSLGPVLEELGTTEIPLQSQLYPLNQRVDYLTQDCRRCAPSLDLDPVPHHFHHLYHLLLHLQTSLDLPLSLHQVVEL